MYVFQKCIPSMFTSPISRKSCVKKSLRNTIIPTIHFINETSPMQVCFLDVSLGGTSELRIVRLVGPTAARGNGGARHALSLHVGVEGEL